MVQLPKTTDKRINRLLADESLPDSVKRPVLESQIAKLKAILSEGRPGWDVEIQDPVLCNEVRDPYNSTPVVQHGDIE